MSDVSNVHPMALSARLKVGFSGLRGKSLLEALNILW